MEEIYNKTKASFLLGSLLNDTDKLYDSNYELDKFDFEPCLFQKILFVSIVKLGNKGMRHIDAKDIGTFLEDYPTQLNALNDELNNDWVGYVESIKALDNNEGFDYYYNEVRKFSLLREYRNNNYDISEFWNVDESEEYNNEHLASYTIKDIMDYYDTFQNKIRQKYCIGESDTQRKKAGDCGLEILESFKTTPAMGLSFESKYLTTLLGGFRRGQLYLRSSDSSGGKSRKSIGDLCSACVPEYWDLENERWVKNPNGKNKGLYIGTEMDLDTEVEPVFWAWISGIESSRIMEGNLTEDEQERVERAISILNDDCIWLVDMPSFNMKLLEDEIKRNVEDHDIAYVVFDYMMISNALVKEFIDQRGKSVGTRADEILAELSKHLKDIAKKFNVGLLTSTQVNSSIKDINMRDWSVIRGSKAVADKITGGTVSMPITKQEAKLIEPYVEKKGFNRLRPNMVETVYKSRFSKYPKECKVFSYYDLGTCREIGLFVTDKNFQPINVPKTIVSVSDGEVKEVITL